MGVGLNWLAVERGDKSVLLDRLGLKARGVTDDMFNAPLVCAEFPSGWLVVVSHKMGLALDRLLPIASADGLALGCEVEEHVMFSRLRGFRSGRPAWTVTHDPDVDEDGVAVEGEPPPPFEEIRTELAADQANDDSDDVDYMFDLPVRLGEALCGYRYDNVHAVAWTILEHQRRSGRSDGADPARPSLWRRMFNRLRGEPTG